MKTKTTLTAAAAGFFFASGAALGAPVTLDFHLTFGAGTVVPPGAASLPPFAGTATLDDSLFGQTDVTPDSFQFQFFDRVISDTASGFDFVTVSLSGTGELLEVDLSYDDPNILEVNSTGSATLELFFKYGQSSGEGTGLFVDGKVPTAPPPSPGAEIPLPASGLLLMGALIGAAALRRRR